MGCSELGPCVDLFSMKLFVAELLSSFTLYRHGEATEQTFLAKHHWSLGQAETVGEVSYRGSKGYEQGRRLESVGFIECWFQH